MLVAMMLLLSANVIDLSPPSHHLLPPSLTPTSLSLHHPSLSFSLHNSTPLLPLLAYVDVPLSIADSDESNDDCGLWIVECSASSPLHYQTVATGSKVV